MKTIQLIHNGYYSMVEEIYQCKLDIDVGTIRLHSLTDDQIYPVYQVATTIKPLLIEVYKDQLGIFQDKLPLDDKRYLYFHDNCIAIIDIGSITIRYLANFKAVHQLQELYLLLTSKEMKVNFNHVNQYAKA